MEEDNENVNLNISENAVNELAKKVTDVFDIYDHANNKTVDVREIGTIIRAMGCAPTEAEVQEVITATEMTSTPGYVELDKFLPHIMPLLSQRKFQPAEPDILMEAFKCLDKDANGVIPKDYMIKLMTEIGEPFTQDELEEMINAAVDPFTDTIPYEIYLDKLLITE